MKKMLLLSMRLTAFILLVGLIQVSAKGFSQNQITLNEDHAPVKKVLQSITKQTGYYFFYDKDEMKDETITIKVSNASLKETLAQCFKNKPYTYKVLDKNVVITKKEQVVTENIPVATDTIDLTGRVVDPDGKPLDGATISYSNKLIAPTFVMVALTGQNGVFYLKGVKKGDLLRISFIGYLTKEVKIDPRMGNIVLHVANAQLDEAHIIAYGKESRRFSVGSTTTVTSEDIEKQPVTNVLQALQGRVPGLNVTSTNGIPGSQVKLQIRGQNTLLSTLNQASQYDQPLFIIDGVPFAPQNGNINQLGSLGMDLYSTTSIPSGVSSFIGVNPNDIDKITVLRDADATSIYGTQGSNGVILITTKKGKPGKATVNITVNTGYNSELNPVRLMNTQQYIQMRRDAYAADGITPSDDPNDYTGFAPDVTIFDPNKYTDWQKTLFGKTSNNTDAHATLSGGSENTTFLVSAGYTVSDYNFPGNFSNNRLSFHSSVNHTSTDNRFSMSFGTDYSYSQNNSGNFGGVQKVLLPPNTPDLLDPQGNLLWDYKGVSLNGLQFYSYLKQPNTLQNYNLNNILHLSYKLITGLSMSANLGYSRNGTDENQKVPLSSVVPSYPSSANFASSTSQTVNIEPQLDYNRTIGKGDLSVLAGGTYKKNLMHSDQMMGTNYPNDALLGSIDAAGTVVSSDGYGIYRYAAAFGRIKYVYDQKYIVSLTGRRDGSSNFGPGHQFGNFGSVGLGWIFSEEKAFKAAIPFISYAKLSGNYGTSGSDGIAPYLFQSYYYADSYAPTFQNIRPFQPNNLYNPNYSWATKKSLNLAFDFGFLDNKILLNTTYYRNREDNQLVNYSLPTQAGFLSVLQNLNASVQNTGWEFTLSSTNIKNKDFSWTTNFNISTNSNKLLAFPGLENSSYATYYIVGKPTTVVMGYKYKDVNPTTGIFEFYDAKGQTTNTPDQRPVSLGGDLTPIANLAVKFFGGLGNDLTYKNFSLSIFFQFSKQTAPNYLRNLYSMNTVLGGSTNAPAEVIGKYWKNPGDQATLQKPTTLFYTPTGLNGLIFDQSSAVYSDDTYLRLKTLSLTYSLPDAWLRKAGITNMRVYVRGQNLLTFTNYKVGDPEQPGGFGDNFPMQRTLIGGLSFNF